MRTTRFLAVGVAAALTVVPVALSAQNSAVGARAKSTPIGSDVRELPADQQIIQALSRLTFGPKPGDMLKVRGMGLDNWIDQQLHPEKIDDSALDKFIAQQYPVLGENQNDLLKQYALQQRLRRQVKAAKADSSMDAADSEALRTQIQQRNKVTRDVVTELQSSRVARAVGSERQLQEVMTDFWENHFNIYVRKGGPEPFYLTDFDENVIRPHALGKFRDLLEAVAKSPAMLFYLDNARSMADSTRPTLAAGNAQRVGLVPMRRGGLGAMNNAQRVQRQAQVKRQRQGLNENYGRELMELHTLGVDGGYTQQDVINVARAFTGWTIKPPAQGGGFVFRPAVHDAGEKVVLGHKLPAGRGIEDAEDVLDILAKSPATAHFIAFKLARHFVSDSPSTALVNRAAQVYLKTDGDIREVLRSIITSPEFFSQQAFHSKVKTPFEVVVSAERALDAPPDSTIRSAQLVAYMGQPIFGHQAPDGWPETGDAWMNTGAILNRINFGMGAAAGRLPGLDIRSVPSLETVRSAPRESQVDAVVATILNGMVSPDTRAVLMSGEHPLLASGSTSLATENATADSGTMSGADASPATSDDAMSAVDGNGRVPARGKKNGGGNRAALQGRGLGNIPQLTGLNQIVGLALGSPEFQRH
jgi:uncharacterized protein (DUF1800 family)